MAGDSSLLTITPEKERWPLGTVVNEGTVRHPWMHVVVDIDTANARIAEGGYVRIFAGGHPWVIRPEDVEGWDEVRYPHDNSSRRDQLDRWLLTLNGKGLAWSFAVEPTEQNGSTERPE